MVADFRRRFWISLAATAPVLALSPMVRALFGLEEALRFPGDRYVLFGLATFIYLYGGYPFLRGLWKELSSRRPGMMTLIGLAVTTAYVYSSAVVFGLSGEVFFWELATLIDIMLLGHWLEMKAVSGASRALQELAELIPNEAHKLLAGGETRDVPVGELRPGDRVVVKPGEKVPADGVVVDGATSVNEAMLTGESTPVAKAEGDAVTGGSINGEGAVVVKVEKRGEDSFVAQVVRMVGEAQKSKSRTQGLADRAAFALTLVALAAGAVTLAGWLAAAGRDLAFSLERTVTVMVITCPHALGLAVPLVVAVSTALSARHGLLVRNRVAFERARNLQALLFDKTGTLTEGEFGVTDVLSFDEGLGEEEVLNYAAAVDNRSEHPLARGLAREVPRPKAVDDFEALPGKGARGVVEGREVKVVSPGYLREHGKTVNDERLDELWSQGKTTVFVLVDEEVKGAVALADRIRPESKEAVRALKDMGMRVMMITGDKEQVAAWVAREVGLDEYFAEVLPAEKAAKVKEVQGRGLVVAMTGDGVNDAPALAQADVGIAVGAGTDVAVETADVVLVRDNPADVVAVIKLGRATYRKMVQNLAWATGYNAFAIPLAAGVLYKLGILLSPAVLMSASTIIVALNARLLRLPA
jgi:Cu2+-exporting ATPase